MIFTPDLLDYYKGNMKICFNSLKDSSLECWNELNKAYEIKSRHLNYLYVDEELITKELIIIQAIKILKQSHSPILVQKIKAIFEQLQKNRSDINYRHVMQQVIRLQLAANMDIEYEYLGIFTEVFEQIYMEVISKHYHDPYQEKNEKPKQKTLPTMPTN